MIKLMKIPVKKIKQIIRVIFPKKVSSKQQFEYLLNQNDLIYSFEYKESKYYCTLKNGLKVVIRDYKSSDYQVLEQIFVQKEYEIILKIFDLNDDFNNEINIIDAGANVGFTSIFFSHFLKKYKIFAIEPSRENCEMIIKNTQNFENIKIYQNALSENSNTFFNLDRNFRDGKNWSIATEEALNGKVKGITINEIINENKLNYISLLKIDIEGAERFIFKKENDLEFLKITQIIAIEIHDEFNVRNSIIEILIKNNFFLLESGELTIGVNKSLI